MSDDLIKQVMMQLPCPNCGYKYDCNECEEMLLAISNDESFAYYKSLKPSPIDNKQTADPVSKDIADTIKQLESACWRMQKERDALSTDLMFYTEDRDFWKDQVTTLADRLATAHNEHTNRIELEIKLADVIKFIEEVRRNGDTRLALMAIDVLDWLRQK